MLFEESVTARRKVPLRKFRKFRKARKFRKSRKFLKSPMFGELRAFGKFLKSRMFGKFRTFGKFGKLAHRFPSLMGPTAVVRSPVICPREQGGSMYFASFDRARESRDRTVPTGTPSASAAAS